VAKAVLAYTGGRGVDVVIENVGAAVWQAALKSAVRGGRIVTCGATSGDQPGADLRRVFIRQLQIFGSTMGNPGEFHDLLNAVATNRLEPVVDSRFGLADARDALSRLESEQQFGKVVVEMRLTRCCGLQVQHQQRARSRGREQHSTTRAGARRRTAPSRGGPARLRRRRRRAWRTRRTGRRCTSRARPGRRRPARRWRCGPAGTSKIAAAARQAQGEGVVLARRGLGHAEQFPVQGLVGPAARWRQPRTPRPCSAASRRCRAAAGRVGRQQRRPGRPGAFVLEVQCTRSAQGAACRSATKPARRGWPRCSAVRTACPARAAGAPS
jgi:hypothetical protein